MYYREPANIFKVDETTPPTECRIECLDWNDRAPDRTVLIFRSSRRFNWFCFDGCRDANCQWAAMILML